MNNNSEREKDINNVLFGVLETETIYERNYNYADRCICPFCYESKETYGYTNLSMKELNHSQDCIWLIAKDLLTNIKKN